MCKRHKFEFLHFEQEKLIYTNSVIGFGGIYGKMMKTGRRHVTEDVCIISINVFTSKDYLFKGMFSG